MDPYSTRIPTSLFVLICSLSKASSQSTAYGLSTFLSARYPTGSRKNAIRLHGNRKYRNVKYRSGEGADVAVESNVNSRRSHCKSRFASRVRLASVACPGFSPPMVPCSSSDAVPPGSGECVAVRGVAIEKVNQLQARGGRRKAVENLH